RTVGSTITGQFVDTVLVIILIFAGRTSWGNIVSLMLGGYLGKVAYEVLVTPLTYWIVAALKRTEGVDVFDRGTNFNPFRRAPHEPPAPSLVQEGTEAWR
ncbi:MAG: VUT family protein, partial [Acidobacteriales bacterium]|nr:VUT family protein [Terriglobales bacterium]